MSEEVLVVEDEANIRELVSYTLMGAGYRVRSVADGESALREARGSLPDLVVLDIRLPGMDGWEVCRRIRELSNVPIVILTALTEDESLVKGLRLGADDYVAKPFSPVVLAARVQALLRRAGPGANQRRLTLGNLSIDLASAEIRSGDRDIHLTPAEFRLLTALLRRPGQVIGPADLMRHVQGHPVFPREAHQLAKVHILHLRRKIEPDIEQPRYVLTVRGMGYMLNRHELREDRE
jgi:DNA-binding response OmpR family regulator